VSNPAGAVAHAGRVFTTARHACGSGHERKARQGTTLVRRKIITKCERGISVCPRSRPLIDGGGSAA
jgi:hypothetical protein